MRGAHQKKGKMDSVRGTVSCESIGFVASARVGPHSYAVTDDPTMWVTPLTGCQQGEEL